MTPNEIEMLIHFHTSSAPHPRRNAPAVKSSTAWMLQSDLIREAPVDDGVDAFMHYVTTAKGAAMIQILCDTPLPECRFVDPRNGEVL